ncbi:TolC family protein [Mangrovibacterium marinum]|uniref:Outer membrane protein n=1 Tax=Mangrovibacterium marinum TaxID=1639118 RepID=A0A2T5C1H7_9BACT|nr:TolC family protein [Mangrovibacterium marinum]PTN08472.1 outer membrane protein [Mangrovibacterium marinum]
MKRKQLIMMSVLWLGSLFGAQAQTSDQKWSLDDCIDYALSKNVSVVQSQLTTESSKLDLEQSKANVLPSFTGSASTNYSWTKEVYTESDNFGDRSRNNTTNFGVNAGMTLFNGFKLKNQIKQSELNLQSSEYYSETVKESLELNILNAYLQILYAQEELNNAQEQIAATQEELSLAQERLDVGVISRSDYLQIKSELATEQLTEANAKSTLSMAKLSLMQFMELPVTDQFEIESPDFSALLENPDSPIANEVYLEALGFKPQIKQADADLESQKLNEKIAKASLLPSLSLSSGLSTGWSDNVSGFNYSEQLKNQFTPTVGLSLSIPIFQNKQGKISVKQAKIATSQAELTKVDTQNELRKNIEQACLDLTTAQAQYQASQTQLESARESYEVAAEKYREGLLNSVDFLTVKTSMITSESDFTQAKFNMVFSTKIVDFYKGIPISLTK